MSQERPRQSGECKLNIEDNVPNTIPFTYKIGGSAVDNTTYTATFTIRDIEGDTATPLLSLTVGSGITLGGADGIFTVVISDAQSTFGNRTMVYNLVVNDGTDDISLMRGVIQSHAITVT